MISQTNFKGKINYDFSNQYLENYNLYSKYLITLNISNNTIEWRLKHIRGFLKHLSKHNIYLNNLNANDVYDYMSSIKHLASRTQEHRAMCIRYFLNFLFQKKIIKISGKKVFPIIKCYKHSNVVDYFSTQEISKMLNTIDINKLNGKRDFLICLLFAELGLRVSDVKKLQLSDIDWNNNKLTFSQSKTRYLNTLPITKELRYAFLDYLKYERDASDSPYIFLKNNKLYDDYIFYEIVNKYLKLAGININNRKHGPHSMRHSLATSLINDGVSLDYISNILGHQNLNETKIYSHVDEKNLKKISLEVPIWKA